MSMHHINFIPAELRPRFRPAPELAPLVLLSVLILYSAAMGLNLYLSTRASNQELELVNTTSAEVRKKIALLSQQTKDASEKNESLASLQKVLGRKTYWSAFFEELSILIPDGIWLTSFSNGTKKESGRIILRGESTSQDLVAEFLTILEKSNHFGKVQIDFSEREIKISPTRYRFQFSIPVKKPQGEDE